MPRRIDTPCGYAGCRRVGRKRYCDEHTLRASQDDERARGSAAQRGYDARHRRWRLLVLARHPICEMCGNRVATVADHVKPLDPRDPYAGDWSLDNGQGLCHACHTKKTREEHRGL